jgi:hypothetical protein
VSRVCIQMVEAEIAAPVSQWPLFVAPLAVIVHRLFSAVSFFFFFPLPFLCLSPPPTFPSRQQQQLLQASISATCHE